MQITELQQNQFKHTLESQAIKLVRQQGLELFEKLGWPSKKDERWKYTSLKSCEDAHFQIQGPATLTPETKIQIEKQKQEGMYNLVFFNGCLLEGMSDFANLVHKLEISSITEALQFGVIGGEQIAQTRDGLEALSLAFLDKGAFIRLKRDSSLNKPLHLIFFSESDEKNFISSKIFIELGENSKLEIIETHLGQSTRAHFSHVMSDYKLARNSQLNYLRVQGEDETATNIGKSVFILAQNSQLHSTVFSFGAKLGRVDTVVKFIEKNAMAVVNGAYFADGKRHLDHQTNIEFLAEGCTGEQFYKGIADDEGKCVFNGRVYIAPGAQKSNSSQLNNNLMLSDKCEIDSKPQLEIFADDVKAGHGSTMGDLNSDEIFYLQSRGLKKEKARELLAKGFLMDILDRCPSQAGRDLLNGLYSQVAERLMAQKDYL